MIFTTPLSIMASMAIPLVLCIARHQRKFVHSWILVGAVSTVLLFAGLFVGDRVLRGSAVEVGIDWSPDRVYRVVAFALPYSSVVPGSGSDGPGFVRIYNSHDRLLGKIDFDMIQRAEVNWSDNYVEIGSDIVELDN